MRLHRLEMTAFGPFADTATVDFDELGADGLFLLHGRTGAGKTTVLDAIAYALYGRVPGARGDKRLHSDHAPAHVRPEVVLEASLGGRHIRLTRRPEFERPKQRGAGTRTEPAKATLAWLDGRGTNLSRIKEIGDEVVRLLGMSADQFFQVVLLPQGDFARFLRAENEDRERLLEKLFDTSRFGSAEQWLAAQRRTSGEEIGAQQRNVEDLITRVAVTGGIDRTERIDILDAVDWSQDLLATSRSDVELAQRELELRRAESAEADAEAEAERRSAELRRRLRAAQAQLDEYAAGAGRRDAERAELDRARRAEPVAAALDEAETAVRTAELRAAEAEDAARRLAGLAEEPESADIPDIHLVIPQSADATAAVSEPARDAASAGATAEGVGIPNAAGPAGVSPAGGAAAGGANGAPLAGTAPARAGSSVSSRAALVEGAGIGAGSEADGTEDDGSEADRALDAVIRSWSALLGKLDELRAEAGAAEERRTELEGLRATEAELRSRSAELVDRRARLPELLADAQARSREADDAKAALPGSTAEKERLQAAASAAVDLAEARRGLDRVRVELDTVRAAHLEAREQVLDLRERRLAGMAAELAGGLVDGQACAVCGSAEHPRPARPGEQAVSEDDEATAVEQERAAEARRDRVQAATAELEREIEALIARGGDGDPVELAATLRDSTDRCVDAAELAAGADECAATLARLRTEESGLHDALRETETELGAVVTRMQATSGWLAENDRKQRAGAGRDRTLTRRRERLHSLIGAAGEWRAARAAARTAWAQVRTCVTRVEKLAESAGFVPEPPDTGSVPAGRTPGVGIPDGSGAHDAMPDSATDAQPRHRLAVLTACAPVVAAAARTRERQDEIGAALAAADEVRAAAQAVLAEPEIQRAAAAAPRDVSGLAEAVHKARQALDESVAVHAAAVQRVTQLETLCGQLWAAVDLITPAQRVYGELAGLADVVAGRGANNRRMSLRSYVLAARLEEVAVAGSVRLRRMSGGRYEFVHTDRAGTHGRRGGLGLDIRDDYTGAIRPARTLSGGETFMASLSLALGLADTVAAEAGGIVLDTLFIDEGFGSLDADTLDAVMGVLDELREGGRVVGLVSHVDEMRQRIPSRLQVIRGRNGSRLQTTIT